uniref:Globin family profile domain-containing protein n=1 Tax=Romanomermis culicivorax TaxID=13658 RepID=A0A915L6Y2_ROMCU
MGSSICTPTKLDSPILRRGGNHHFKENDQRILKEIWTRLENFTTIDSQNQPKSDNKDENQLHRGRQFLQDFLFCVMTENKSIKICFNLGEIADENLLENSLFQTHVGNFFEIFRVIFENINKKFGAVNRKARSLGQRHKNIRGVKFTDENWSFMVNKFTEILNNEKYVVLNKNEQDLVVKFLFWFFGHMNSAYCKGEDYDSSED